MAAHWSWLRWLGNLAQTAKGTGATVRAGLRGHSPRRALGHERCVSAGHPGVCASRIVTLISNLMGTSVFLALFQMQQCQLQKIQLSLHAKTHL